MDEQTIRLRCLEIAIKENGGCHRAYQTLEWAKTLTEFCLNGVVAYPGDERRSAERQVDQAA